jgi:uncharacterized phosphosugar-binding protein
MSNKKRYICGTTFWAFSKERFSIDAPLRVLIPPQLLKKSQTVQAVVERGIDPPLWMSANLPGGDEANKRHFERYGHRVKCL